MSRKLKELLAGRFSPEELRLLVGGYDLVGDIAVVIIPESLNGKENEIAKAILDCNRRIRVVVKRAARYGGEFRTLPVKIIGGENRLETEVIEFGIRLRLNIEKVYFSIRSGGERRRIASLVRSGEEVLVLFSGIAPYPLMISRYSRAGEIVAVEKNPVAHRYAEINVKLNKRENNIKLIHGDVEDIVPSFSRRFDRLVMVYPKGGERFLHTALDALKPGGTLHFYDMQHLDALELSLEKVRSVCMKRGRSLVDSAFTVCGHCAPRTHRICVDCLIET
jgi:tRNA (guanine37-N1)-methyltransferase